MSPNAEAPLVVTLGLDAAAQTYFDGLRREHFPAHRLRVGAHLTLFHALPAGLEEEARRALAHTAATRLPLGLEVTGLVPLGRGVAYRLRSDVLVAAHRDLQRRWEAQLTPQDRQPLRPHVTVQNKVSPEHARHTLAVLEQGFAPFTATGVRLRLWRYLGGPWEHVADLEPPGPAPPAAGAR